METVEEFLMSKGCGSKMQDKTRYYYDVEAKDIVEFTKLNAIVIIKKLSKTEAEYQYNIKYVFPQYNIK